MQAALVPEARQVGAGTRGTARSRARSRTAREGGRATRARRYPRRPVPPPARREPSVPAGRRSASSRPCRSPSASPSRRTTASAGGSRSRRTRVLLDELPGAEHVLVLELRDSLPVAVNRQCVASTRVMTTPPGFHSGRPPSSRLSVPATYTDLLWPLHVRDRHVEHDRHRAQAGRSRSPRQTSRAVERRVDRADRRGSTSRPDDRRRRCTTYPTRGQGRVRPAGRCAARTSHGASGRR